VCVCVCLCVHLQLIPKRVAESAAAMALSTAQKEVMKLTAAFDTLSPPVRALASLLASLFWVFSRHE